MKSKKTMYFLRFTEIRKGRENHFSQRNKKWDNLFITKHCFLSCVKIFINLNICIKCKTRKRRCPKLNSKQKLTGWQIDAILHSKKSIKWEGENNNYQKSMGETLYLGRDLVNSIFMLKFSFKILFIKKC